MLFGITDKVTEENKTIQVFQDGYAYSFVIKRDPMSLGRVEIRLMNDRLFLEVYQPGKGEPVVITVMNKMEEVL